MTCLLLYITWTSSCLLFLYWSIFYAWFSRLLYSLKKKKKKLIKMGIHPPIWKTASYGRKTEASNCIHLPCEVLLCKYICAGGNTHILSISNTNVHTKYLCFNPTTRNPLKALNFISKGQTSWALYNPKGKTK